MFKKRKVVFISILAVIVMTAASATAVGIYASEPAVTKTAKTDSYGVLVEKVATILGLETDKVQAAFDQAISEIKTERAAEALKAMEARLDQMVADGKLTAEEAAKYKEWLESKPNIDIQSFEKKEGFERGGMGKGRGFERGFMPRGCFTAPSTTSPADSN
ncbi:MAG TPA: hypothetical protein VLH15_08020 [Dehalococcoidales bacterium]|nr:hypothetical protein [Dehalococcoidales bacterium]